MDKRIKVMLSTEGTYPHNLGGVSTWCNTLVENLDNVDFLVYSIIMNPYVTRKFELPKNSELITVPLWGIDEPFEYLKTPFSKVHRQKSITTDEVIYNEFLPIFQEVVEEIISVDKNPTKFGDLLLQMHKYFKKYDYKDTFKSELVWSSFTSIILERAEDKSNYLGQPSVFSMIQSLGWLYRFFSILCAPVPKVDLVHSAAAAFCGIPCVLAKLLYKTPYLLTEHGVYIREQYLSLSKRGYDSYLNTFFIRLIDSVVKLNYSYADEISPVCDYNKRWEKKFGVLDSKIKTIHNGVDKEYFSPRPTKKDDDKIRIVSVARVDPVKDLITLIKAAQIVNKKIKNATFHVYGSITVPEYYKECQKFVKDLGMQDIFKFEGNTNDTPLAYASGDVIVLSSITEGFPYSVVEAMMMGKPVIASDVGGISEAVTTQTGILVTPRKPEEFADAIIRLVENEALREQMGVNARQRAEQLFDIDDILAQYYASYTGLIDRSQVITSEIEVMRQQRNFVEKGMAMISLGDYSEGIAQLRAAIKVNPQSIAVPQLLNMISQAYESMGELAMAENERQKANIYESTVVASA